MRSFIRFLSFARGLLIGALLFSSLSFGEPAPFSPEVDARFKKIENGTSVNLTSGKIWIGGTNGKAAQKTMSGEGTLTTAGLLNLTDPVVDGLHRKAVARFVWDFAVQGGASTGLALDANLPANSLITRNYFYVVTQETGLANTTTSVVCGTANLFSALNILSVGAGSVIDGVATGASTGFQKTGSNACQPYITFGVHPATAGKIIGWAEYETYQ